MFFLFKVKLKIDNFMIIILKKLFMTVFFYLYNLIKTNDNVLKIIKLNTKKLSRSFLCTIILNYSMQP